MIDKLRNILSGFQGIDGFRIIENKIESSELFFVRKEMDMNRVKSVHDFRVTLYKDFEEDGEKYRGSSTVKVHPTMDDDDIKKVILDALFSAGFVKNKYYPLHKPSNAAGPAIWKDSEADMAKWLPILTDAIFKQDVYEEGCINSAELFLNNVYTRIINSEGVDVSYKNFKGELEYITNWNGALEEIELMGFMGFGDCTPEILSEKIDETLKLSRDRAIAQKTPHLKRHMVLLTGEPVKEFFNYYYTQSSAKSVYDGISTLKLGQSVQGEDVSGDRINMKLDPFTKDSAASRPYDDDGMALQSAEIIKDGVLKRYFGSAQNSYYLNVEPTGVIENIVVGGGSKSVESMKDEPYLELAAFSHFQMNPMTGDFAGEIRLGWYFDGEKRIPVTGGSISGNAEDVHKSMYLSKELQQDNNFIGPKTIQLYNVTVVGLK